MPPFDGNILQNMPMGLNSAMGDIASSAWQMPMDLGRMPGIEPAQLGFSDIFQQVGAMSADNIGMALGDTLKNASNVAFSTPEMNQLAGKQADFFVNAAGKLTKNPASQAKPGDPLNIEIQGQGADLMNQFQGSAVQSIIDTFLASHPGMASFPKTWQDVLNLLHQAATGTSDDESAMQRAAYSNFGATGGGGDSGGGGAGGGGGGGGEAIRPVEGLAPPVVVDGKVFPVVGYHGKVQMHHGSSDGAADLFAPAGTPIQAMEGGEVLKVSSDGMGGNTITIRQADGKLAYYAHMEASAAREDGKPLQEGDTITTGEVIGRVGETGNAAGTGSHLHIGVGDDIQNGGGAEGGAGTNFNLTGTLNAILGAQNV